MSIPCHLCFTGCVEDSQAFINHAEFAHFLPHCPSFGAILPTILCFLFFWEVLQSKSKLGLSAVYWNCDAAQINTLVIFTQQGLLIYNAAPPSEVKERAGWWWEGWPATSPPPTGVITTHPTHDSL